MFIFLSKVLPPLLYPLGLTCGLILLAIFLDKKTKVRRTILVTALIILWLASSRWVSHGLAYFLESRYPASPSITSLFPAPQPPAEAIVLLGGGTLAGQPPRPLPEVNEAGDRVIYTAYLYHQLQVPYILITGGTIEWLADDTATPTEEMATLLGLMGVPSEVMLLESRSRNTYENALYSKDILAEKGITRIILVTSALHMPRSVLLFEKQGIEVIPAPTDFNVTEESWQKMLSPNLAYQLVQFLPSASNLELTTRAIKEYLGLIVYRLQGWL
jgi:uncharacterized SAM-binding protein YcdF (DUF218 family)